MNKITKKILVTSIASTLVIAPTAATAAIAAQSNNINNMTSEIQEKMLFKNNDEVANYFKEKNELNNILNVTRNGKASVIIDSYQQSNKLSHSEVKNKINFKYSRVCYASNSGNKNHDEKKSFMNKLNNSSTNYWSYDVNKWWAKAGQRYMGNCIIVPMWAPEVFVEHDAKTYDAWTGKNVTKFKNFAVNEIRNIISNLTDDQIKEIILKFVDKIDFKIDNVCKIVRVSLQKAIDVFDKTFITEGTKLKPIMEIASNDTEIKNVSFGNIEAKVCWPNSVEFHSNNVLPITDYRVDTRCGKATCSHNLRHLGDVIITSIKDLMEDNFYDTNSFLGKMSIGIIEPFLCIFALILATRNEFIGEHLSLIILVWNILCQKNIINKLARFLNSNKEDVMLELTGKVEKHGIQLGKCGHLVSGVKIRSEDNVISLHDNNPYIVYSEKRFVNINKKIFSNDKGYNFNTLHCIVELDNYSKLNTFLQSSTIPEMVKSKLVNNINKLSLPSSEIFQQYSDYVNKGNYPKEYNIKLKSFRKFASEGWIVPNDISYWSLLAENILPSIFSEKIIKLDKGNRKTIFNNFNFSNNDNANPISEQTIFESSIYEPERMIYNEVK